MYGVNLFRLARLAGLRQIDIARHLKVVKVQPNLWAKGNRPIPEDTVPLLVAFIAKAVEKRLDTVLPWETTRAELTAALRDVFAENCKRYGHASQANLETFLAEVEAYTALPLPQQQNDVELARIERITAAVHFWMQLLTALLPLVRLLPDEEVARPVADEEALTAQSKE